MKFEHVSNFTFPIIKSSIENSVAIKEGSLVDSDWISSPIGSSATLTEHPVIMPNSIMTVIKNKIDFLIK